MPKTRAIRFSDKEESLIKAFLRANPYFDFSSLARTSIIQFIGNPKLELTPVRSAEIVTNKKVGQSDATI